LLAEDTELLRIQQILSLAGLNEEPTAMQEVDGYGQ
jgi:hypothetical protein